MFQFAGFAPLAGCHAFSMAGCPIRMPADHIVCADPRGFSQLIASFVASGSLGIPHTPLSSLSPEPFVSFAPPLAGRDGTPLRGPHSTLYGTVVFLFQRAQRPGSFAHPVPICQ